MSGVVIFDPIEFRELYPNAQGTDGQLANWFSMAESYLNNTKCSLVKDLKERKTLLYLLVAHMATLEAQIASGNSGVGRVSSATEGTVSVSLDYGTMNDNERWYLQTPYGATYWQMIKKYRSFWYRLGIKPMPVDRTYYR